MTKWMPAALTSCLLTFTTFAYAASVDLGAIGANDLVGDALLFDSGETIDDDWTFTLTEALDTAISVVPNDFAPFFEITGLDVSSGDAELEFDGASGAFTFAGFLEAGTYTFMVAGLATGASGGQYQVLVGTSTAIIPLPLSSLLLASALVGLAVIRRRA